METYLLDWANLPPPTWAQAQAVLQARCAVCHNEQVVVQRTMPQNNATQVADDEHALLGRWVAAGAPVK